MLCRLRYCLPWNNSIALNRIMAAVDNSNIMQSLELQANKAETVIQFLKSELNELQKLAVNHSSNNIAEEVARLKKENEKLKHEIEKWKNLLIETEKKNGKQQFDKSVNVVNVQPTIEIKEEPVTPTQPVESQEKKNKQVKKEPTPKKEADGGSNKGEEPPVDVGRLDFRIGQIINVKKHPDADSLYVEEVNMGEDKPRTVVSGLVKHVPIEQMQNRMVVLLCNLKPAKMRGITSEAMVMCASTVDKVEILTPPEGSSPGDLVHFEGYTRNPDSVLNPKKKIFETVAPDLKTDDTLIAMYKGVPFTVPGKGAVTSQSLANVNIK